MKQFYLHSVFLICGLLIASLLHGQDTTFIALIGGGNFEEARDVVQTSDGNYLLAGATGSFGSGQSDIYLVKLDSTANLSWSKTIGGPYNDWAMDLLPTSDGGYLLTGYSNSLGAGGYDGYLVKVDSVGNTEWDQYLGGSSWDFLYQSIEGPNGRFYSIGKTFSFGFGNSDIYVICSEADGQTVWTETLGGTGEDFGNGLVLSSSGKIYLTGGRTLTNKDETELVVMELDDQGQMNWQAFFGDDLNDYGNDIIVTSDSQLVVTGSYGNLDHEGRRDIVLIKTDTLGASIFQERWFDPIDGEGYQLQEMPNNHIAVFGFNEHPNAGGGGKDFYIVEANADGDFQGGNTLGTGAEDHGFAFDLTYEGGYIYAGMTEGFSTNLSDILVYKAAANRVTASNDFVRLEDSLPIITSVEEAEEATVAFRSWIAQGRTWKLTSDQQPSTGPFTFRIYDLSGRTLDAFQRSDMRSLEIYLAGYPAGTYLFEIIDRQQNRIATGKLPLSDR